MHTLKPAPYCFFLLLMGTAGICFQIPAIASPAPSEWEEVSRTDDVTVYRKEVPGSPVLAYRATAQIDAPIAKVMGIVRDTIRLPEWTYRVKNAEIVEEISKNERIIYMHASAPWPVTDRDSVVRSIFEYDITNQQIQVRIESIEDPRRKEFSGKIRAWIYPSRFVFKPLDDGKKTHIVAELHGDPKGSIPKWVVNMIQKRAPVKTLQNLKKRVQDSSIEEDPLTLELLKAGRKQAFKTRETSRRHLSTLNPLATDSSTS